VRYRPDCQCYNNGSHDAHELSDRCDVSVVVPVFRSRETLRPLVVRLRLTLEQLVDRFEIILVDDGSSDGTWQNIQQIVTEDPTHVVAIELMRNYGQHNALMCGFRHARGAVIVTMDDDLQHEPESIPRLLQCLSETGADLVYGAFEDKRHGRARNLGSAVVARFYRLVFQASVSPTAYRAIRRELVESILKYDLNFTYIDGLLAWNTRRIAQVVVPHHERANGRSGYSLGKLLTLAINMFTNFSLLPLQMASLVGLGAAVAGLLTGGFYLAESLLNRIAVPGYASTIVAVMTLGGLQLLALGVIGEYVGRLHLNINRKPQFTIRQVLRPQPGVEIEIPAGSGSRVSGHSIAGSP